MALTDNIRRIISVVKRLTETRAKTEATMEANMQERIDAIAAEFPIGSPSAVKRGRNPEWPYIALITGYLGVEHATHNPMGRRAYATREEAIAAATRYIAFFRADLRAKLANPRMRALREQHGLPSEI